MEASTLAMNTRVDEATAEVQCAEELNTSPATPQHVAPASNTHVEACGPEEQDANPTAPDEPLTPEREVSAAAQDDVAGGVVAAIGESTLAVEPVTPPKAFSSAPEGHGKSTEGHGADAGAPPSLGGDGIAAAEPTKRPKSAFFLYLESERANMAATLGVSGMSGAREIARHAGEVWRSLPEDARAPFVKRASELKAAHDAAVQAFLDNGGVRAASRKKRCRTAPETDDSKNGSVGEAPTPKKLQRPRERVHLRCGIHVVEGVSEQNASIEAGVRLLLKRDWRRREVPNAMAVYEASLGSHVGSLSEALSAMVAPILDRNAAGLRISGRVPEHTPPENSENKAPPLPTLRPCDVYVALAISGPVELRQELMEVGQRLRAAALSPISESGVTSQ